MRVVTFSAVFLYAVVTEIVCQPEPEQTMDQLIMNAAESSMAMDYVQDNGAEVLVELDIRYTRDEWNWIKENGLLPDDDNVDRGKRSARVKRKAIHNKRWTNKVVPYIVSSTFSPQERNKVSSAINEYHKHTCLNFRRYQSGDRNWLAIQNGGGCSSFVGMSSSPGRQPVSLARNCRHKGIIIHELGHAIGMHHEQTRPDRDSYVSILYQNIPQSVRYNFQRYTWQVIKNTGVPYDYTSVMHYGAYAFSTNGRPTIMAKNKKYQNSMGNRKGFSFRDIKLINIMYSCNERCTKKVSCPGEGFQGKDCRCYCPSGNDYNPVKVCGTTGTGTGTGTGGGGTTTTTTTTTTPTARCIDKNRSCRMWRNRGFCTDSRYLVFMRSDCARSCRVCGGTTASTCVDSNHNCRSWSIRGECRRNPRYMLTYCKRSCRTCRSSAPASASASVCVDNDRQCPGWARIGECRRNPRYMLQSCKRSCSVC